MKEKPIFISYPNPSKSPTKTSKAKQMYSSSFASNRLVFVHTLVVVTIQLLLIRSVSSINMTNSYLQHKCYVSQGKYKPGSVYEKNLNSIIHTITANGNFHVGYDMRSLGDGPDFISLVLQCRGDSYGPKCRTCYTTALSQLRRKCPKYKGGIIWYDQCFVAISGINTEGKIDYDNNFCMSNAKEVTGDQVEFHMAWISLLDNLTSIATGDNKLKGKEIELYAAGERRFETNTIYAMVQCTKDLSVKACQVCVSDTMVHFDNTCYEDKQGGRVLGRSCSYRFELYPFVNTKGPKYLKT